MFYNNTTNNNTCNKEENIFDKTTSIHNMFLNIIYNNFNLVKTQL